MSPTLVSILLVLFQSSSQTWTFQNNTGRHSCTLEHKWDFKQHRQEGLFRAWSWMFLGGKVPAPPGWTLTWSWHIYLELVSHIGMALNRKGADWNLGLVLAGWCCPLALILRRKCFQNWKVKQAAPSASPPQALLNVLCSACWSWDPLASRREDSFLYEWPNDRCTIFCPRKACQVVGISGWPVLNKIQEKFHLVNPGEVPGFCFCVLFFLL